MNTCSTVRPCFLNGVICLFSLQKNPVLITDFRDDIKKECEKFGEVRKVIVFDVSRCIHTLLTFPKGGFSKAMISY